MRRLRLVLTGLGVLLAFLVGAYVLLEKSQEYDPTVAGGRVVLYAVLSLNIVLVLALAVTFFRNVVKLLFEWRRDLMGSRFSIKLVAALTGLAIIPTALLFVAGSEIIKVTTARWFSTDVDAVTEAALHLARAHREALDRQQLQAAEAVAAGLADAGALDRERLGELPARLEEELARWGSGAVAVILPGLQPIEVMDARRMAFRQPTIPDALVVRWRGGERFVRQQELPEGRGALRWAGAAVADDDGDVAGVVVLSYPLGASLAQGEAIVTSAREEYERRELSKGFVVATNVSILLLVTLLLLFAAVWMGLVLARGITIPIQRLAEGTRAVATGNLDHRVEVAAADELRVLVDSFNLMTADLKASKAALVDTVTQLRESNDVVLERRRFIETVLETVAAGVLAWDREGRLTTCNPAAIRTLRLPEETAGRSVEDLLAADPSGTLRDLVRATLSGAGPQEAEVTTWTGATARVLQALTSPLSSALDGSLSGAVLVLEDVSELVKAQKSSAWREVARRMAHEIKNPLTPIQLSAERVILKVDGLPGGSPGAEAMRDCARMILDEVRTLKSLVDEFSRFARLPEVSLRPGALNDVVRSAVALYDAAVPASRFRMELGDGLPEIPLDAEQMKRAVVNLVDNALEAMGSEGIVSLATREDRAGQRLLFEVADEGPGIPLEARPKLFLPHFSTKKRGTGLGLAIVDRIVADHGGYIRVEDNVPRGVRFVIEIPLPRRAAQRPAGSVPVLESHATPTQG